MSAGGDSSPGSPPQETGFEPPAGQRQPKLLDRARPPLASATLGPAQQEKFFCTEDEVKELRCHERSGRSLVHGAFVVAVEGPRGRTVRRGKPGPKRGRANR
jgi:hypothetical protein